jgi:hypothetical protein
MMPKMDGFELYDKITKIDKKVKVFFISAFDIDRAAISKKYSDLKIENFLVCILVWTRAHPILVWLRLSIIPHNNETLN